MDAPSFDDAALRTTLDGLAGEAFDGLTFGVIGFDADGTVQRYNARESTLSGLAVARVLGRSLFTVIAPCLNNELVAGRFAAARQAGGELDTTIAYVLALRLRPEKVRLRLLAAPGGPQPGSPSYVLIERRR